MLSESLKKKVQFVKEISDAVVKVQSNIEKITYEIYHNKRHDCDYLVEFVVIHYKGGGKSARCCTGNSCSAIFQEIATKLNHGYYDELDYYKSICDSENMERIDE